MLVAVGLFALMDAGLKSLTVHYPPMQVAAIRGLASLPFVLAWVLLSVGPQRVLPTLFRVRWSLHLLRGVLGITMMSEEPALTRQNTVQTRKIFSQLLNGFSRCGQL